MLKITPTEPPPGGVKAQGPGPAEYRRAGFGLDLLNLWVANIQTGFGPFVAVYLTSQGWTQTAIGLALSLGTLTAMASQLPAGALVDAMRSKSRAATFSILAFAASALLFALFPVSLSVYTAEILHGFSSCTLGPAIAALSLAIAGQVGLGRRLGRNARFASIGNGIGAALMGACGYYITERAVFFLTAALTLPAVFAIRPLARFEAPTHAVKSADLRKAVDWREIRHVLADRRLLIFAACAALFTLSDSAMLPIVGGALTKQAGAAASLLIAACIVLPQVVVALLSPSLGGLAETRGRRIVLLLGFSMLPLRGLLFALTTQPVPVLAVQTLNGIASASFLIMVPLVTSDVAGRSGHFNLALGFVGFAIGIGGTFSTTLAGWVADHAGESAAFAALAAIGMAATLLLWGAMPETLPATGGQMPPPAGGNLSGEP
ncbi:MAG: Major facilitator superfamily transporter [Rhodospirillales bacterium]|nr:Major facilitator superfamily transporter [Rhodospirillales bacterium]